MARIETYADAAEMVDTDQSFTVNMVKLTADGDIDETTDLYDWVVTVNGDGTIHVWFDDDGGFSATLTQLRELMERVTIGL